VRIYAYNARLTSTFGGRRVNELRFQWSRDFEFEFADQPPPETDQRPFSFGRNYTGFLQTSARTASPTTPSITPRSRRTSGNRTRG